MAPSHFFEEQSLRERVQGLTAAAACDSTLVATAGGDRATQQQHADDKLNFKLIRERIPEERGNHNYWLLSRRKDLSVIVGSTENISSAIGTAGTNEKKTTRQALLQIHRARPLGSHLPKYVGNTAGKGTGKDMDGLKVANSFGWILLKQDTWF